MSKNLLRQHLFRAWIRHWPLQVATVTVMTLVLMMLNSLFLGFGLFRGTLEQWGQGLEMIVFLKEGVSTPSVEALTAELKATNAFDKIEFTSKVDATSRFLSSLGTESMELIKDPKWSSPIPASLDLSLDSSLAPELRVPALQTWSQRLRSNAMVEDVFYGQGWIENFSRFVSSARGLMIVGWILSLAVGLLIVSNCIRLSFLQRRDEIEILELVGATSRFIRIPFLIEGMVLGFLASLLSLGFSYALHASLLTWLNEQLTFWLALKGVAPLQSWMIAINIASGISFGALGAWNCVRRLNTGWSAAG
jgi:cell division transport system permease protein